MSNFSLLKLDLALAALGNKSVSSVYICMSSQAESKVSILESDTRLIKCQIPRMFETIASGAQFCL